MKRINAINVLIVEDEQAIRDMIRFALPADQFSFQEATDTVKALRVLQDRPIDLILLDWMLPDRSGIEFIAYLRGETEWQQLPIIMLTAKAEEENRVKGLEVGADDYVTKPFSPAELAARIKTVLRRGVLLSPSSCIDCGELEINLNTHKVTLKGAPLELTPIEYRLLHFFVTHQGKVYTRDQLITLVWGGNVYIEERSVDVQMKRLRKQLKHAGYDQYLKTIRGAGYMFEYQPEETLKTS